MWLCEINMNQAQVRKRSEMTELLFGLPVVGGPVQGRPVNGFVPVATGSDLVCDRGAKSLTHSLLSLIVIQAARDQAFRLGELVRAISARDRGMSP